MQADTNFAQRDYAAANEQPEAPHMVSEPCQLPSAALLMVSPAPESFPDFQAHKDPFAIETHPMPLLKLVPSLSHACSYYGMGSSDMSLSNDEEECQTPWHKRHDESQASWELHDPLYLPGCDHTSASGHPSCGMQPLRALKPIGTDPDGHSDGSWNSSWMNAPEASCTITS